MGRIIFLGIAIFMVLLPDLYIYFSKVHVSFSSDRAKKIGKIFYFSTLLIQFGGMFFLMYYLWYLQADRNGFTNILQAFIWTMFIVKFIMLPFLLFGDIYKIFELFHYKTTKVSELPEKIHERRNFIKQAAVVVAAIPFFSFLHGMTLGKYNFKIKKIKLAFKDLPESFQGFKIAQFSDFHAGSFDNISNVKYGLDLLQKQGADVILFTGDLVNHYAEEVDPYIDLFQVLNAPYGQYASTGNHDYGYRNEKSKSFENIKKIKEKYAACNFKLLNNENIKIEKNGEHINIAGVENWGAGRFFPKKGDLDKAFENINKNDFTILMSHDPTHWDTKIKQHPKQVHLTLSGHTHGAQMGVELFGLKWSPGKYVYKRWAGLYEEANQYLYVNRGFGMLEGFSFRTGIFPEITVFELEREV